MKVSTGAASGVPTSPGDGRVAHLVALARAPAYHLEVGLSRDSVHLLRCVLDWIPTPALPTLLLILSHQHVLTRSHKRTFSQWLSRRHILRRVHFPCSRTPFLRNVFILGAAGRPRNTWFFVR